MSVAVTKSIGCNIDMILWRTCWKLLWLLKLFRSKNIGLGNGQRKCTEFEEYVLEKRKHLRDTLKLCERATQRVLLYSNNFLHKKLKTDPSVSSMYNHSHACDGTLFIYLLYWFSYLRSSTSPAHFSCKLLRIGTLSYLLHVCHMIHSLK